jgi:hypothetical protein
VLRNTLEVRTDSAPGTAGASGGSRPAARDESERSLSSKPIEHRVH